MSLEEKVAKLQAATDEAKAQIPVAKQALDMAQKQLADAKAKYQSLSPEKQATLQVNDTELPELIETELRAQNVYDTVLSKHATNERYLAAFKQKLGQ
ncbi:unnamed protein product [Cylindrotheca closterium]|uniref:Uncharacterized protein n=1 Tax=Cylindrotheca closterium TaxID=2856 RepID=A0AAD2CV54_9STRA|nr:unnamed protein product [Cylindrotheca closterium]